MDRGNGGIVRYILPVLMLIALGMAFPIQATEPAKEELRKEWEELHAQCERLSWRLSGKERILKAQLDALRSLLRMPPEQVSGTERELLKQLESLKKAWDEGCRDFARRLVKDAREIIQAQFPDISGEMLEEAVVNAVYAAGGMIPGVSVAVSIGGAIVNTLEKYAELEEEKRKLESMKGAIEGLILRHMEELRRLHRIVEKMFRIGRQLGKLEAYRVYEVGERDYWMEFDEWSRKRKRMMEIDMELRPELFAPVYTIPSVAEIERRLRDLKSALEASQQFMPPKEHICCQVFPSHVRNAEIRSNLIDLIFKILDQLDAYTTEERQERLRVLLMDVLIALSHALENKEVQATLLDLLDNHHDPWVRGAAAHALSLSADWTLWEAVADRIWTDDSPRARAAYVLALNPHVAESMKIVIQVYEIDPHEEVRRCALMKLSEFLQFEEAIDYLVKALTGGPSPASRAIAAAALGIGGVEIEPDLRPYVGEALRFARCDEDRLVASIAGVSLELTE